MSRHSLIFNFLISILKFFIQRVGFKTKIVFITLDFWVVLRKYSGLYNVGILIDDQYFKNHYDCRLIRLNTKYIQLHPYNVVEIKKNHLLRTKIGY